MWSLCDVIHVQCYQSYSYIPFTTDLKSHELGNSYQVITFLKWSARLLLDMLSDHEIGSTNIPLAISNWI